MAAWCAHRAACIVGLVFGRCQSLLPRGTLLLVPPTRQVAKLTLRSELLRVPPAPGVRRRAKPHGRHLLRPGLPGIHLPDHGWVCRRCMRPRQPPTHNPPPTATTHPHTHVLPAGTHAACRVRRLLLLLPCLPWLSISPPASLMLTYAVAHRYWARSAPPLPAHVPLPLAHTHAHTHHHHHHLHPLATQLTC